MEAEGEYFPCSPQPDCPFWGRDPGCYHTDQTFRVFEDTHHEYQVEDRMTPLMRIFRNLPRNLTVACRRLHRDSLDKHPQSYPDIPTMKAEIINAEETGEVSLSNNKRKVVGLK